MEIAAGTLTSVAEGGVTSVSIETDVGTLTLNQAAWAAVTEGADGSAVTLAVDASRAVNGIWTITARAANGSNVFEGGGEGRLTVSVPYSAGGIDTRVYCTDNGGLEKMETSFENGFLTWSTPHLSTFQAVTLGPGDQCAWNTAGGTAGQAPWLRPWRPWTTWAAPFSWPRTRLWTTPNTQSTSPSPSPAAATSPPRRRPGRPRWPSPLTSTGGLILDGQGVTLTVQGTKNARREQGQRRHRLPASPTAACSPCKTAPPWRSRIWSGASSPPTTPSGSLPVSAKITVDNAALTADGIDGNFSNGGWYTFKNGAQVTLENCGSHALSANRVTVEGSQLTIRGAGYRGISINDTNGQLAIYNNSEVTIEDCGEKKLNGRLSGARPPGGRRRLPAGSLLQAVPQRREHRHQTGHPRAC